MTRKDRRGEVVCEGMKRTATLLAGGNQLLVNHCREDDFDEGDVQPRSS